MQQFFVSVIIALKIKVRLGIYWPIMFCKVQSNHRMFILVIILIGHGGVVLMCYANCGRGNTLEGKWNSKKLDPMLPELETSCVDPKIEKVLIGICINF